MTNLAIHGGKPVRQKSFTPWPIFGKEEEQALVATLKSGQWWRNNGNTVREFEKNFSRNEQASHCLAVTNGTHAIELALMALFVGYGDEVIVPAITFISTASAVQRVDATPVIVDVIEDTYNIDAAQVEKHITRKTKAIIAVHMAGQVADMDALVSLSRKYGIPLIQDAAHAQGAKWRDKGLGGFDSMATYSFQNSKLMTCGEGGAVTFPSQELYDKAFMLHNCGRQPTDRSYIHTEIGSNYRMSEFSAAILDVQLKRLKDQSDLRNVNYAYLKTLLNNSGILFQKDEPRCTYNPVYMIMFRLPQSLMDKRDMFVEALNAEGVPAFRSYRPLYQIDSMYKTHGLALNKVEWAKKCPVAERIGESAVWMPHNLLLGDNEDIHDIVDAITKVGEALK